MWRIVKPPDWRNRVPTTLQFTLPALDSGVYLRENKLLFCSRHLYFGFWIQNLIPECGMLQIPSKM